MECRRCSLGLKQAAMTPSFLSGLEMRNAVCDGPNGMRSPRGPGLALPGDRSLAPQQLTSTKYDAKWKRNWLLRRRVNKDVAVVIEPGSSHLRNSASGPLQVPVRTRDA